MESEPRLRHDSEAAQTGKPVNSSPIERIDEKRGPLETGARQATGPFSNWKELLAPASQTALKALVISHDGQEGSVIAKIVEKCGAEVSAARDGIEAVARMRKIRFDLVFVDLHIPEMHDFKFIITAKEIYPETEIFVVTPYDNLANAVECTRKGAEAFIIKPDIVNQVAAAVAKVRDRRQSRCLIYMDGLTSLFNHNTFQHFLRQECNRSVSHGRSFGLLVLDIDHFKLYNDLNGHLLGDIALIKLGKLLKESLRASDIPARYGGDEFAVILTETSLTEALVRANRIEQLVALAQFQHEKNMPERKLTVSMGLALHPQHGKSHLEILRSADHALHQAKAFGGYRLCIFGMPEEE